MAAAYAFGVIRNHPFIDGNKRTGFLVACTFLGLNGWRVIADLQDVVDRTLAAASGECVEEEFAAWLEEVISPVAGGDE